MSWYSIDAVDRAFSRTRKALFEPFDFWKWVKLAIIIFFVGSIGSHYGGPGSNFHRGPEDYGNDFLNIGPDEFPDVPSNISGLGLNYAESFPSLEIIAAAIIFFIGLILVFSYISSIMEFVFVESLVLNEVHLRDYVRKFMRKGFNLFMIRLALLFIFIALFVLALLPFIPIFRTESTDIAVSALIGGFFWIFAVIILLALIGAVISSFLSLAIPISIYRDTGILSAFNMVYRNFRKSWQEVLVYWFVRLLLGIAISILAFILFVLLILLLLIVSLIIDGILFFLFSALVSEPLLWILLVPFILIELLFIFITLMMLSVPLAVFLKYHLLSFLEKWFSEVDFPFFDKYPVEPETGFETVSGAELNKYGQDVLEKDSPEPTEYESGDSEPTATSQF